MKEKILPVVIADENRRDFPLMSKIADVLEISIEEIASYEKNGYIDRKEGGK